MRTSEPRLVDAAIFHGRRGGPANAFRYRADFVLLPVARGERPARLRLFSHNRANVFAHHDRDHGFGGEPAADWARGVVQAAGLGGVCDGEIWLLTQPRRLGLVFNPVSFWFFRDRTGGLRAVIAEVNNTFGDRHAYLCHRGDHGPIGAADRIEVSKALHVSPFQDTQGRYAFRFRLDDERVGVWIDYRNGERGLYAALTGGMRPMTDRALLGALLRRPLGGLGVLAAIHWQALGLALRGARYRPRPAPPREAVSS